MNRTRTLSVSFAGRELFSIARSVSVTESAPVAAPVVEDREWHETFEGDWGTHLERLLAEF